VPTSTRSAMIFGTATPGYWATLLRDRGADVVATDPAADGEKPYHAACPLWTNVEPVDG
jgi:hypothetical protein